MELCGSRTKQQAPIYGGILWISALHIAIGCPTLEGTTPYLPKIGQGLTLKPGMENILWYNTGVELQEAVITSNTAT
jgi:hypothetical protein